MTTGNNGQNKGLGNLVQWKPGQSGNPNGRPKDVDRLAQYIREQTNGCRDVAMFMMKVMRGEFGTQFKAPDRLRAAEWLADRGVGKAKEIAGDAPIPLAELSDEELMLLERIAARRAAAAGGDSGGTGSAQSA